MADVITIILFVIWLINLVLLAVAFKKDDSNLLVPMISFSILLYAMAVTSFIGNWISNSVICVFWGIVLTRLCIIEKNRRKSK